MREERQRQRRGRASEQTDDRRCAREIRAHIKFSKPPLAAGWLPLLSTCTAALRFLLLTFPTTMICVAPNATAVRTTVPTFAFLATL